MYPGRHRLAGGGHHRRPVESDRGGHRRADPVVDYEPVRGVAGRPLQPHPLCSWPRWWGQMVVAVALAWVVQIDAETFWVLVAFSLGGGATASVGAPVQQAIVVELVPGGVMRNAVFLNSTQWNISRAVGPMLGGWLIQYWGPAAAFWFNAASFTVLVVGLEPLAAPTPAGSVVGKGLSGRFPVGVPIRQKRRGHPSSDAGQLHAGRGHLADAVAGPGDRRRRLRCGRRRIRHPVGRIRGWIVGRRFAVAPIRPGDPVQPANRCRLRHRGAIHPGAGGGAHVQPGGDGHWRSRLGLHGGHAHAHQRAAKPVRRRLSGAGDELVDDAVRLGPRHSASWCRELWPAPSAFAGCWPSPPC